MTSRNEDRHFDLVCEGGGVKGIGLVGALSVLEERGFEVQNIAGNSAGAIVATLFAAGYSAAELREIVSAQDFRSFMDKGPEDRWFLGGRPLSILLDLGIYEGDVFQQTMADLLAAKGIHLFGDLIHPKFADDPRYRYKVQVIASDLTTRRMLILPQDAVHLGIEPDDLSVALAIRMSMSVPIFFEPVRMLNPKTGQEHIIVDGGVLSNYPVWLFDSGDAPEWPTFGLRLVEPDPQSSLGGRLPQILARSGKISVVDYIFSLAMTMLEAHDRLYIERADFARTIPIPTLGITTLEFGLPNERLLELYESGRQSAEKFLSTWDFEGYVAEFRSGKQHSRREEIAAQIRAAVR